MTYQEYPPIEATHVMLIADGHVINVRKVDWFGPKYDADIVIMFQTDIGLRWNAFKVITSQSPWGAYRAAEKFAANFFDITELHMIHTELRGYGTR